MWRWVLFGVCGALLLLGKWEERQLAKKADTPNREGLKKARLVFGAMNLSLGLAFCALAAMVFVRAATGGTTSFPLLLTTLVPLACSLVLMVVYGILYKTL